LTLTHFIPPAKRKSTSKSVIDTPPLLDLTGHSRQKTGPNGERGDIVKWAEVVKQFPANSQ
jgi:hypothetical protein